MTEAFWDWNEHVPSDLIPAVKHIRHLFEEAGWKSRIVTQQCCYGALHPEQGEPGDFRNFASNLITLKALIGRSNTQFFHDLLKQETPSAILKAFFHFYQEVMAIHVKFSFRELLEIGSANASRIGNPPIDWAARHVKSMVGSENFQTGMWLKQCCDVQDPRDRDDFDFDVAYGEEVSWTSWRAPRLASMYPALGLPFEASRIWEREDEAGTRSVLKAFKRHFALHLETTLESCQGEAHLQTAKKEALDSPQPEDESSILNRQGSNLPSGEAGAAERIVSSSTTLPEPSGINGNPVKGQKGRTPGRKAKIPVELRELCCQLWSKESSAKTRVSTEGLKRIAQALDSSGYTPPSKYLYPLTAKQVKDWNQKHGKSSSGAIHTWLALVENGDPDFRRGMCRLMSNLAHQCQKIFSDKKAASAR